MLKYRVADVAVSLSGRDKGKKYLIAAIEPDCVYLYDGDKRTRVKLKKKNKKHIQVIYVKDSIRKEFLDQSSVKDEEVRRFLKVFGGKDV